MATTCVGQAVAVGAVLLAAGAPGKRAALPHARIILDQPAAQGRGAIPDLILEADEVERVRTMLEEVLAQDTGRSIEQIRRDTERDLVLTAEAALAYGLVDRVLEHRPAPPAARALR